MNTTNTTANTTTFPDSWYDLYKLDQPLDFEAFLNSDLLATTRNEYKTLALLIYRIAGSVCINHRIYMPYCAHSTFTPWSIHDISSVGVWTMYR